MMASLRVLWSWLTGPHTSVQCTSPAEKTEKKCAYICTLLASAEDTRRRVRSLSRQVMQQARSLIIADMHALCLLNAAAQFTMDHVQSTKQNVLMPSGQNRSFPVQPTGKQTSKSENTLLPWPYVVQCRMHSLHLKLKLEDYCNLQDCFGAAAYMWWPAEGAHCDNIHTSLEQHAFQNPSIEARMSADEGWRLKAECLHLHGSCCIADIWRIQMRLLACQKFSGTFGPPAGAAMSVRCITLMIRGM